MNIVLKSKLMKPRQIVLEVFEMALENEMDEVTLDDVDNIVLGFTDALIDEYESFHYHDKEMVQHIVNNMLDAFYYESGNQPVFITNQ
jgi:hypothetical protein